MEEVYEIHAMRYGSNEGRTRQENFLEKVDDHDSVMPLDYYIWLIRNENRSIVVDTGFDHKQATKRGRSIMMLPSERLSQLGVNAWEVEDVIITHLHYDHAGTLRDFPKARFHIQETEMQFATGPWMLEDRERFAYSAEHVAELIHCLFSQRVRFHQQDGEVAPGITVHRMPGHTMGMQSVRVRTRRGWVLLASDASITTNTGSSVSRFQSAGPVKTLSPVTSNLRNSPKAKTMLFLDMTPWSGSSIRFLWTSLEMKR